MRFMGTWRGRDRVQLRSYEAQQTAWPPNAPADPNKRGIYGGEGLLEYQTVAYYPLHSVFSIVRSWENSREFSIEFDDGSSRRYSASSRDSMLAVLLTLSRSGQRASGGAIGGKHCSPTAARHVLRRVVCPKAGRPARSRR